MASKPTLRIVTPPLWSGKPHDPTLRGYRVVYRAGEVNRCPGCGRSQWLVGRISAECVFCGTALPLAGAV